MKREDDIIVKKVCNHEFKFLKEFEDSYEFDCVSNCIFCNVEFYPTREREMKAFFRKKPRHLTKHDELFIIFMFGKKMELVTNHYYILVTFMAGTMDILKILKLAKKSRIKIASVAQ